MGKMSRSKGAAGERELATLLRDRAGATVTRNLSQTRDGGHDLEGLPWAVEVKRYREAKRGLIRGWWEQACSQADLDGRPPLLAYRQDRDEWRFVLPGSDSRYEMTAEVGVDRLLEILRESLPRAASAEPEISR